jgi:hypothetical protein
VNCVIDGKKPYDAKMCCKWKKASRGEEVLLMGKSFTRRRCVLDVNCDIDGTKLYDVKIYRSWEKLHDVKMCC